MLKYLKILLFTVFSLITYNYICKIHPPTQQCGRSLFRAMECWLATGFPK